MPSPNGVGNLVASYGTDPIGYLDPGNWPTDPNYTLFTPDHLVFPYLLYDLDIEYLWNNGQLQAPVSPEEIDLRPDQMLPAGRQASPSIQVAAPYGRKIVRFNVSRRGVMPVVPYAWPQIPNEILVYATTKLHAPVTAEDGMSLIYQVQGLYVYNLLQPYWQTDNLMTGGATDVSSPDPNANVLPPDNYWNGFTNLL